MSDAEELSRLREELEAMQRQLDAQAARIEALEGRTVVRPFTTAPRHKESSFSLENFIGLRLIQFIGIIVLVIGLSIGVKYAIDRNLISTFMRIALAYGAGLVLYGLSVRLKKNFTLFSALLFSGGMASLYFTTYAAYVYYGLFSFAVSFGIMIFLTVYAVYEALRYDRQEIALLGLVGAYGIPFLISKNADRAELFFLYITLINAGVVFLCIRKLWNNVGRAAQVLTWILFIGWTSTRIRTDSLTTGWIFLIVFYLTFVVAVVGPRLWRAQPWSGKNRGQMLLNNIALYTGACLLSGVLGMDMELASVTLAIAAVTAAEGFIIRRVWPEEGRMAQAFGALALLLFVTFIGLRWDGFTVTLLWLLTAVVVFGLGFWLHSVTARLLALVLIGVTLGKLVLADSQRFTTVQKVIAYLILGVLLLVTSFFYQKFRQRIFANGDEQP